LLRLRYGLLLRRLELLLRLGLSLRLRLVLCLCLLRGLVLLRCCLLLLLEGGRHRLSSLFLLHELLYLGIWRRMCVLELWH
jgi:hypothetical protein